MLCDLHRAFGEVVEGDDLGGQGEGVGGGEGVVEHQDLLGLRDADESRELDDAPEQRELVHGEREGGFVGDEPEVGGECQLEAGAVGRAVDLGDDGLRKFE